MTDADMAETRLPPVTRIDAEEARRLEIAPWDRIAPLRARDLDSGNDPSFERVILPTFRALLAKRRVNSLLDIGCGVGRLTRRLSSLSRGPVTAIDPSPVSTQIAQEHLRGDDRYRVHNMSIEQYTSLGFGGHDAAISSMVMQDVVDLPSFLESCRGAISSQGSLFGCITHPYFWPTYWHYDSKPWYRYDREIFIRSEFRTSLSRSGIETLHVHRPVQSYVNAMISSGFSIRRIVEPVMTAADQRKNGVHWTSPHFLFIEGVRRN